MGRDAHRGLPHDHRHCWPRLIGGVTSQQPQSRSGRRSSKGSAQPRPTVGCWSMSGFIAAPLIDYPLAAEHVTVLSVSLPDPQPASRHPDSTAGRTLADTPIRTDGRRRGPLRPAGPRRDRPAFHAQPRARGGGRNLRPRAATRWRSRIAGGHVGRGQRRPPAIRGALSDSRVEGLVRLVCPVDRPSSL